MSMTAATVEQTPQTPRDRILKPLFFDGGEDATIIDAPPVEVFRDPRFGALLNGDADAIIPLFEKFFEPSAELSPEEIDQVARAFRIALLTWHTKLAWLERVVEYKEGGELPKPHDTSDLIRAITEAASKLVGKLERLKYKFVEDARVNDFIFREIREQVSRIHERLISVVLVKDAPVARAHNGLKHLPTMADFEEPPLSAGLYFGGSKRSDLACATNGDRLLRNLETHPLDPGKFVFLNVRVSGRAATLIVPRGAQGIVGLKTLFKEVGILIDEQEATENPDVFYIGVPDKIFEGVEGVVQNGSKVVNVDGGYKRFHHTRADGSMVYAVGNGKDSDGRELDYFGPFKKALFQLIATRELQEATGLLARTGRKVTQPGEESRVNFKYYEGERVIDDAQAAREMVVPFHGTTMFWCKDADTRTVAENLHVNVDETVHHTLFEGQSGMGKSEMEQFIHVMVRNLRVLHDVLKNSTNSNLRELAHGLFQITKSRLYSSGDDMGHLFVEPETGRLVSTTHERGRFTRTDNIPQIQMQARQTLPLTADGVVASTTNSRVVQRDETLEAFHQVPMAARMFVLATNLPLDVDRVDSGAVVQLLDDIDSYINCYANYANRPTGTKDSDEQAGSPGAMHEFAGQWASAGTVHCENLAATRRFVLEREQRVRAANGSEPMRFFLINTGIKPDWLDDEDVRARLRSIEDDRERISEIQKIHFAHAANCWSDVDGLLPSGVQRAFVHARDRLFINLGKLAYISEHWSEAKLRAYFEKQLRAAT